MIYTEYCIVIALGSGYVCILQNQQHFVYKEPINNNQLNNKLTVGSNKIFEVILKNFTAYVWRYCSYREQSDCYGWEGNAQEGLHLHTELHFQSVNHTMVKIKVKVPYTSKSHLFNKANIISIII